MYLHFKKWYYRMQSVTTKQLSFFFFKVKCEQYWDHGTKHFENITVTTTSEIPLEDWTIRDFDIKNVSGQRKNLWKRVKITVCQ